MQDKESFGREISACVTRLPDELVLPDNQYDFILRLLKLRSSERPITKAICTHQWLEGAFDGILVPPLMDPTTPKHSFRGDGGLSPSLSGKSLGSVTPNTVDVSKVMISQRERHMLEVDTERSGHSLHLPPIEPATPSVGRARKFLNNERIFTPTSSESSGKDAGGSNSNSNNNGTLSSSSSATALGKSASEPNGSLTPPVEKKFKEANSPRSIRFEENTNSIVRSTSCNGLLVQQESRTRLQSVSEHDDSNNDLDSANNSLRPGENQNGVDSAIRRLTSKETEVSPLMTRTGSGDNSDGSNGSESSRTSVDPLAKQLFDGANSL
jgi:hypothetical protein